MAITASQTSQVLKLNQEGYSLRQIATEVGVSKSSVERILKEHEDEEEDIEQDEDFLDTSAMTYRRSTGPVPIQKDSENTSLGRLKLELHHKEVMADKEISAKKLALEEKKHHLEERQEDRIDRLADEKRKQQQQSVAQRKQTFVRRFHKLVTELIAYGQNYSWEVKDVELFLEKLSTLQEAIEDFTDEKLHIDYEELAIWYYSDLMIEIVTELYEEWSSRIFPIRSIKFDLSDDILDELEEAAQLKEFDELCHDEDNINSNDYEDDRNDEDKAGDEE
jgi:hypothetical protein